MIIKKIQRNESVKFRVPVEVAETIKSIKADCLELGWKFTLEQEIADAILKTCRKAAKEIEQEKADRAKMPANSDRKTQA